MKKEVPTLAHLVALGLACAATACAATPAEQAPDEVWAYVRERYDADGDGRVARSEYGRDEEHWRRLDKDGDGFVVASEVAILPPGPGGRPAGEPSFDATEPPQVGEQAPDFELEELGREGELVRLSSYRGERPVALVFGSYT
jgi:hypothetical protein